MGTKDRNEVHMCRLNLRLPSEPEGAQAPAGQVDMAKVRGFLHSMGDTASGNALQLMKSVEEYQQVKFMAHTFTVKFIFCTYFY